MPEIKIEYFINAVSSRDRRILDLEISNAYLSDRIKELESTTNKAQKQKAQKQKAQKQEAQKQEAQKQEAPEK